MTRTTRVRETTADPVEFGMQVRDLLRAHATPEVAERFAIAFDNYLYSSMRTDFGKALGLTSRARKRYILRERDRIIRQAFELCRGDRPTTKARRLNLAIENFRDQDWPTAKMIEAPPADWDKLRSLIFCIFRTSVNEPIPTTQRGLEIIILRNG